MSTSLAITAMERGTRRRPVAVARNEERDLISQAQGGSRAAFDHLMNLYQSRIFRTARRLTGNAEDARDVLQSAFMKAFVNLPRFRGESQFSTWLTTITLNEARMAHRRRRMVEIPIDDHQQVSAQAVVWSTLDRRPDPEWKCLRGQLLQLVEGHVAQLPLKLQMLIHLRYQKDLSVAESALLLGISYTAAKSQLHRGMILLRKSLRQQLRPTNEFRRPRSSQAQHGRKAVPVPE